MALVLRLALKRYLLDIYFQEPMVQIHLTWKIESDYTDSYSIRLVSF